MARSTIPVLNLEVARRVVVLPRFSVKPSGMRAARSCKNGMVGPVNQVSSAGITGNICLFTGMFTGRPDGIYR